MSFNLTAATVAYVKYFFGLKFIVNTLSSKSINYIVKSTSELHFSLSK